MPYRLAMSPNMYLLNKTKWLRRESNSCYRRERAMSWPLDHGALSWAVINNQAFLSSALPTLLSSWNTSLSICAGYVLGSLKTSPSTIAPPVGLEPTTLRLTAECSTDWAKEDYIFDDTTIPCSRMVHFFVPSKPNTEIISDLFLSFAFLDKPSTY